MKRKAFFVIIAVGMITVIIFLIPVFALMIAGVVKIEPVKFSEELSKGAFDLFRLVFSIALGTYLLGFLREDYLRSNKRPLIDQLQQKCRDVISSIILLQGSIKTMDSDQLLSWYKEFKKLQFELSQLVQKIPKITSEQPDPSLDDILNMHKAEINTHFNAVNRSVEDQDGIISQSELNGESVMHLKAIKDWCNNIIALQKE